jgi:predicted metal-dependent phosphoesterase TrpH
VTTEGDLRRYDLQVHTRASPCSRAEPVDIVESAVRHGLDGLVVTDHDTVRGYPAVAEAAGDRIDVLPGCEVTTTGGHMLAIGVEECPSPGPPRSVVEEIHDSGGVAVLSHPFDRLRAHYRGELDGLATAVDAVEVRNSRCLLERFNDEARRFASETGLPVTGGSDAHFPVEVGRAYTVCRGELLEALRSGATEAVGRGRYMSGHLATKLHDAVPQPVSDRLHAAAPRWA